MFGDERVIHKRSRSKRDAFAHQGFAQQERIRAVDAEHLNTGAPDLGAACQLCPCPAKVFLPHVGSGIEQACHGSRFFIHAS